MLFDPYGRDAGEGSEHQHRREPGPPAPRFDLARMEHGGAQVALPQHVVMPGRAGARSEARRTPGQLHKPLRVSRAGGKLDIWTGHLRPVQDAQSRDKHRAAPYYRGQRPKMFLTCDAQKDVSALLRQRGFAG